jgi:hypothetical protein
MSTFLRIQVDDDTLAKLQQSADTVPGGRTLEDLAALRLKGALTLLPPGGRVVVLSSEGLQVLEPILGGGSILNEQDLLKKVQRLAGISFQHVRLPFTPNQLEALTEKATRQGLSVDQLVERTAPRMYEHFFDLVARV